MLILRSIRKNKTINYIVRNIIKFFLIKFNSVIYKLSARWRTSGVINCQFNEVNFKMYNNCDDDMVNILYYKHNSNEDADLNLFSILSEKSNVILDIGANTGIYSIISSKVNPKSTIYGFEPFQINIDRFKTNIKLNNILNVFPIQKALSDKEGEVEFTVPSKEFITGVSSIENGFSEYIYPEIKWKKITVEMNTLDAFRESINSNINLINCDVEKHEMAVFNGMKKILKNDRPTILFECFLDDERNQFFNNILKEFEYYLYLILEEGVVFVKEGFVEYDLGRNYLITPKKPLRTFISFKDKAGIQNELLK